MADLDKTIKEIENCTGEFVHCNLCSKKKHTACRHFLLKDALELLKKQPMWNDASKRPPKQGRYLVWGLHEFTPDHNDQPNAYWQTRIATWFDKTGWDTKVKFWMELPEPPEN